MYPIYLSLLATLGALIMGYDIGIIGSALLFIKPHFSLSNAAAGMIVSLLIPGAMTGNLLTSVCADRLKRTAYMTLAAIIFIVGYSLILLTDNYLFLLMGRFICGLGVGIILVIVPLYLAEIAPDQHRGKFLAFFQLSITFGNLLGYLTGYWLSHYHAYQPMFACGLLLATLFLFACYYLPASIPLSSAAKTEWQLRVLFNKHSLKLLAIGNGLAILQQFTGINAIIFFSPQIMQTALHLPATNAILPGIIIMAFNFIFTIVAIFSLDKFGRKPVLMISLIVQALALACLALLSTQWFVVSHGWIVCALAIYVAGFAIGLGPLMWLITAELYPSTIRTTAMSVTVITNNVAAFIIASTFLSILGYLQQANTFWLFSGIALVGILFTWRYVPETKDNVL